VNGFSWRKKGGRRQSAIDLPRQSPGGSTHGADNELLHLTDSLMPAGPGAAGLGAGRQWPCSLLLLLLLWTLALMIMSDGRTFLDSSSADACCFLRYQLAMI